MNYSLPRSAALAGVLLVLIDYRAIAEELPKFRPALIGNGPKAPINLINVQDLLKTGQGDAMVMFDCLVYENGSAGLFVFSVRGTSESKNLEREILDKVPKARFIPAICDHKPETAGFRGTAVFSVIHGKPHLRIFANQEVSELKQEHDFIAPQQVYRGRLFPRVDYPYMARMARQTGTAQVLLTVDSEGHMQSAEIVSEKPAGVGFGAEALKSFDKAVFIPAFRDGKPTASKTTATFYFPHL
jgi:TonB family protein